MNRNCMSFDPFLRITAPKPWYLAILHLGALMAESSLFSTLTKLLKSCCGLRGKQASAGPTTPDGASECWWRVTSPCVPVCLCYSPLAQLLKLTIAVAGNPLPSVVHKVLHPHELAPGRLIIVSVDFRTD